MKFVKSRFVKSRFVKSRFVKLFLLGMLFLSFGLVHSKISIKSAEGNTKPLGVLLRYDGTTYSFYNELGVNKTMMDVPFIKKIGKLDKKLISIKVYALPLKDNQEKEAEITKDRHDKKLAKDGQVEDSNLSKDDKEFLMEINGTDLVDDKNYLLTMDGKGFGVES